MKIVELLNALKLPITNEESDILDMFNESETVLKADLEPREQLLANNLVNKEVLLRKKNPDGQIAYHKKIR
jgi:hypothetical protein